MTIFKKLSWFFKNEKKAYTIAVIALILVAIFQTIPPRVIGIVIDGIDDGIMSVPFIVKWATILIVVAISQYILRYVWRKRIWGNAAKLEQLLRLRLFRHFTEMDHVFFQTHRTGDLMAHATNDLMAVQDVAGGGILTLADSIITGGSTIIAMILFVDWRLTLIALIPLPLLAVASKKLGDKIHAAFVESQDSFSRVNDKTQESITGIKVIKTFGQENEDIADFNVQIEDSIVKNKRVNLIEALFDPVITFIVGISYVLTILFAGHLVMSQSITIGQLISFISYIAMLIWPMYAMGRLFNILERGNASYDRVLTLLDEKSSITENPDAVTTPAVGNVDTNIDSFSYPDSNTIALEDIKFHLTKGNTLGIAGKTGAGKTTLIKLILREYDNYEGIIEFGSIDIKEYSLQSLLTSIGYVPQDHFLFSMTVMDNIRFGKPNASVEEVEAAAKMADIHEDILGFSDGYKTMIGERGVSLSGGQKQRISIARALLVNPELLILDDALSAVDAKTEEKILSNLREQRRNKTTIIVAHRLSSLMHAEEILVFSDGKISERGTHDSLCMQDGWYQSIFEAQQLEIKLEESEVTD